ncbi:helix-turn-helix domain-containing protein [Novosphingobium sp.]|uniref:helix-turn-helix domain-containing protein n=1 Tax=Novosphingobium sp. TaxID=1874826 RepID=UPI00286E0E1E|nr:helix-turn-helix domain-containing protein [Novosphingobium sp.]
MTEEHEEITPEEIAPRISTRQLIAYVAVLCEISPSDVTGKARFRHLVSARAIISKILRDQGNLSYPQIGRRIGGRDHSTIINAVRLFDIMIDRDPDMAEQYRMASEYYASGFRPAQIMIPVTIRAKQTPVIEVASQRPRQRARNDFRCRDGEPDQAHRFHAEIAAANIAFVDALHRAQAI